MEKIMAEDDKGLSQAFETTYLVVTGKLKLENLGGTGREIFMLYDPLHVEESELKIILEDIIEHYIETEEYEKCQEIKELLNSNLKTLIPKITYKEEDVLPQPKYTMGKNPNSIDRMIDILKYFSNSEKKKFDKPGTWTSDTSKKPYKKKNGDITAEEFWTILSEDDKIIFSNELEIFASWIKKIDDKLKNYYIERVISGKPLIPPFDGYKSDPTDGSIWPTENKDISFDDAFEDDDETDYENKVVISFIDNLTCISNYDLSKIHRIKFQLLSFGILETEIRKKKIGKKTLYTLVYDSQQNINKLDWN